MALFGVMGTGARAADLTLNEVGRMAVGDSAYGSKEQVRDFVTRMYQIILERDPDDAGLDYWTDRLLSNDINGADYAVGVVMSEEFIGKNVSDEELVDKFYLTFLNRPADQGGQSYWVRKLREGNSRKSVLAGFVNSAEFTEICKGYGIDRGTLSLTEAEKEIKDENLHIDKTLVQAYVTQLYERILGRSPDDDGLNYWTEVIMSRAQNAAVVAKIGFFESEEYRNKNKSNKDFVTDCYLALMGREPDEAGFKYWVDQLDGKKMTRAQVIEIGFGKSYEFSEILRSFQINITVRDNKMEYIRSVFAGQRYIVHAGGSLYSDGKKYSYTNSYDTLENLYSAGNRISEFDFRYTSDGHIVCAHDGEEKIWAKGYTFETVPTLEAFLKAKCYGIYRSMSLAMLADFMRTHEDFYVVTDVKDDNIGLCRDIKELYPDLTDRFVIQIYHESEFEPVQNLGFDYILYTLYRTSVEEQDPDRLIAFYREKSPVGIAFLSDWTESAPELFEKLHATGVPTYVHTINDKDMMQQMIELGVTGIYTDEVDPALRY